MIDDKELYNEEKIKYLNIQLLATIGFIVALLTSYLLTLDKKLSLENKKRLFPVKIAQNLAVFQTLLVFMVSFTFLYINYKQYIIASMTNNEDEKDIYLQIETSILAVISAIISIYIVFKNYNKNLNIAETELF